MSGDDKITKPERVPLLDLAMEEHKLKLLSKHDALVLNEFRNMLKRQSEQELAVEELRGAVDTMAEGMIVTIEKVQTLQRNVETLERHLKEYRDKQKTIVELCDHLVASVAGITEP